MRRLLLPLALLLVLALPSAAQEKSPAVPDPLPAALAGLRDADSDGREAALEAVLALEPALASIRTAFAAGLPAPATREGWHVIRATDEAGISRPCHVYVPKSVVEGGKPAPLLVDMHGGVSRPEFIPDEAFARYRGAWVSLAEEHGFVVAAPIARKDCVWWSDAGVAHVRASIRHVKRLAPIDDDRIVGAGFSDGGSACYYLAMAAPDPFAALMPMNGHPGVAIRASGRQLYLENMRPLPLFVAMTQDDGLYPGASVLPHVLRFWEIGGKAHLVSYPTGGHSPSYFEDQKQAFARFITSARRVALPRRLSWRTASPAIGTTRWLEILEIGASEGDAPAPAEVNVMSRPGRILLGITIKRDFPGPGAAVDTVRNGSPAKLMDMRPGDVIRTVDAIEVLALDSLRGSLGKKRHGEAITVGVDRDGKRVELAGRIPAFKASPMYGRTRPTASIDLIVEDNRVEVSSRNVRRFRLLLSTDEMFALGKPITVVVNGQERAKVETEVSVKRLLERYAVEADAGRLFPVSVEVTLPAAR